MEVFGPTLTPWFYVFLKFSSQPYIDQIEIPVYTAFAGKDIQVHASSNAHALREMTSDQPDLFNIVTYPDHNHLFQTAESGSFAEYATNPETFNEKVLEDIARWIKYLNYRLEAWL